MIAGDSTLLSVGTSQLTLRLPQQPVVPGVPLPQPISTTIEAHIGNRIPLAFMVSRRQSQIASTGMWLPS